MDIKNLIIVLLAAALGITALEATNVIDLLNNNGNDAATIKVDYVPQQTIQQWQTQFGKPLCSTGQRHGYFFPIDQVMGLIADAQSNPPAPGQTLKGIMVFPYLDNTGDLNIYLGVSPDKYINHPIICPTQCESW